MKKLVLVLLAGALCKQLLSQNVGIGTATPHPTARLHVDIGTSLSDGLLVTGTASTFSSIPDLGAGTRMMFYPGRGAFRAGTALGTEWNNSNAGDHSAAFGYGTKASGHFSFAAGYLAQAAGVKGLAIGENTLAAGPNSMALGYGTQALGATSLAVGYTTTATGAVSTAIGTSTNASGAGSTALGVLTNATGDVSTALGNRTTASGVHSTAMGFRTTARAFTSFAFGRFNDSTAASITEWIDTDPLLTIGNGTAGTPHNAMVIYKNGNLVLKNPSAVITEPASFSVPISGAGTRLMWLPEKSAFRVGTAHFSAWNADMIGLFSFASGSNTTANGLVSTAMGATTFAQGEASTAMGNYSYANGAISTAMGHNTFANGAASTSMGRFTRADGECSSTMGYNTVASAYASLVIGRYNSGIVSSPTSWISTDPLLVLGNGTPTVASDALVVYKNGSTEINGNTRISGFTKLGNTIEAAPAIKMKKLTGTGPAVNGSLTVAHGLDAVKILSVQVFMQYGASPTPAKTIPPNYTLLSGFEYQFEIDGPTILITNKSGNSANIGGKGFRMLITYEE